MSELTDVIDGLTAELEEVRSENEWLRTAALQMAVKALAVIGTYGSRDEGGLTGLPASHWREIARLESAIREKAKFQGFVADSPGMVWACPKCGRKDET